MVFPTYIQEAYAEAGGRALAIYLFVSMPQFEIVLTLINNKSCSNRARTHKLCIMR